MYYYFISFYFNILISDEYTIIIKGKLFRESSGTFAEPGAINGRHNTDPSK